MKLTTTLNLLEKNEACQNRMETLLAHIGYDYDPDKPINLLTILESNGVNHCLWAFQALEQEWANIKPILISIVADMAESVLHIFEKAVPDDDRPRKAIEAARYETDEEKLRIVTGKSGEAARAAGAARTTAWAAGAAASEAAHVAARATLGEWAPGKASGAAEGAAACAELAARSESWVEEETIVTELIKLKQTGIIKKYLTWE